MTLTFLKKKQNKLRSTLLFSVMLLVLAPFVLHAQSNDVLSLSVTPTLFEMSAVPSQAWQSSVKVINNNPYTITVYASVVNFAPRGETGEGKFVPLFGSAGDNTTLAEWITVSPEAVRIPPEESISIPISVHVPDDAAPGGHFAAILVGTRPLDTGPSFQVRTSQLVTSLFFVRIAGDVVEDGTIREFRTQKQFVSAPEATFEVRFENKGNVHLQPQGEIVITNMWGKERGIIPINHKTRFGNVLPESIRKFDFAWTGEYSFSDIGIYKAELTLAYGVDARKFVTSATYFYVVPFKALSIVLGSLLVFVLFVQWMIKAYVRRMLALAGVSPEGYRNQRRQGFLREGDVRIVRGASLKAPVDKGVADLRQRMQTAGPLKEKLTSFFGFVFSYRIFFISVLVCIVAGIAIWFFFDDVLTSQRDYEVIIDNADTQVKLSSEEIHYERTHEEPMKVESVLEQPISLEQTYELVLVNSSDTPGSAANLRLMLEKQGYNIGQLLSDFTQSKERTVIVYDQILQEDALVLSKLLGNALLSARPEQGEVMNITIFIGNDHILNN